MASIPVNIQFNAVGAPQTIAQINAIADTAVQKIGDIARSADTLFNDMNNLSFKLFMFQMMWVQLQGAARGFYDLALKSNEDLRQSILSTESSLVAVADVYRDGIKIEDSTEAIKALGPAIEKAIKGIREQSLDLVGVTSEQLIPLFQILANNAGKITNQSKEWKDPIEAAEKLTISFAAGLGTLGIPIRQARQEIQSMLQGYVDQNSLMAKQLGISNDQVRLWQKQGVLVDELVERLQPLVDGNKLAAQSISGIGSNILEVIQEIQRIGTEPLYKPVVDQLQGVYGWLKKNQEELAQGTMSVVTFLTGLAEKLGEAFQVAFDLMAPFREQIDNIGQTIATLTGEVLEGFVAALSDAAIAVGVLLNALNPLLMAFNSIMTIMNDLGITRVVAFAAAIALMTSAVSAVVGQGIALIGFIVNLGIQLNALLGTVVTVNATFTTFSATSALLTSSLGLLGNTIVALTVKMGAMLAAAAPLIIALGALADGWMIIEGQKLDRINKAMDDYSSENEKTLQSVLNAKLAYQEAYKEAVRGDGVITEAEQKILDAKRKQMEAYKPLMAMRLEEMQALRAMTGNEDQQRGIDLMIKNMKDMMEGIDEEGIKTKLKGLKSIGDAYKYLSEESVNALKNLKENQYSDKAEADRDAKTLINNTKQEIELGITSLEEAKKRYAELSKLSYLDSATRIAAEKEITNITRLEGDRRKDNIEKQQQEIQELISKGKLSQITGEKEITEAQIRAASERLRITKELIAEQDAIAASHGGTGTSEAKRKLLLEQEKIEAEIAKARRDRIEQENKTRLTDYDEMSSSLERQKEQRLIGEGEYYRRSAELSFAKLDEQIRQTKAKLGELTKSDKEGREVLLAQIDDFEAKKAKIVNDSIERGNKIALTFFDQQTALLSQQREQRLIGEEEFYRKSVEVNVRRLDEQIRQNKEQLERLAKSDLEGRTVLLTQLADLETKKAKIINDADQRLLQQRVQAIRIANELLKIESEKANQILTTLIASAEDENKQTEIGNKALATKKSLIEAIAAVEKSYLDLVQASKTIELSNSERALDYNRKLQDEKIKGTELERVYQEELQKLGKYSENELQLLKDKQEAEANLFNAKLTNLLKEQELQKQLLELDLLREKSQLNQFVNQEKINVLKAQQSANEARGRTLDAEQRVKEATLSYQDAIKQGRTPGEIEEARIQLERSQIQLSSAQMNEGIAQKSIGYAQQSLGMAEDNLGLADILAQSRREVLRNKQNNEIQSTNEQADRLRVTQRIEQATLLTQKPELGSSRDTPTINRAGYTRYGIAQQMAEYGVGATGDRRLDSLFGESQRGYIESQPPSERDRILSTIDRRITNFTNPLGLPTPRILQDLSPQSVGDVLPGQINQIINLLGEVKGGLSAIASTKTPVNPTINNNFNGPIDDTATMAKYRKTTLEIIDNVIPKF